MYATAKLNENAREFIDKTFALRNSIIWQNIEAHKLYENTHCPQTYAEINVREEIIKSLNDAILVYLKKK